MTSPLRTATLALVPLLTCAALALSTTAADVWVDVTTPLLTGLTNQGVKIAWPGGCSGVVVDRLSGDVITKVVGQGLWRSSDQGTSWQRVLEQRVSGRDETGWTTSVDQNDPRRIVSFSLDGFAAWTVDGSNWTRFTDNGRNWDYGSVDWSAPAPRTILVAKHETTPPGEVDLSTDGGASWRMLSIRLANNRNAVSMLGVMDAATLIYGNGDGIFRSTDTGTSWTRVAAANPQTRIPVLFKGAHYLGTTNGLLVSTDRGAHWQAQGEPVDIWLGPFFGADERHMVIVGKDGAHETADGGKTWKRLAALKSKSPGFAFSANWFGCYAWDPIHRILYASAMGNPLYQLK